MHHSCLLVALVCSLLCVSGWHDLTNVDYHCWPLTASHTKPETVACPGLEMRWVVAPPDEVRAETWFNVTFELHLEPDFWRWAVGDLIGSTTNYFSHLGISGAAAAQDWCELTACPGDLKKVSKTTCCFHHVNVHSCPLETSDFCGPWIKPTGQTYTHSHVLWGNGSQLLWTSSVMGLYHTGTTQLIAHFKMADFQFALSRNIKVLPKTVCGDVVCESGEGETCDTCPADCGRCPLTDWQVTLVAIATLTVIAMPVVFIALWYRRQQKLLWDESWIISRDDIKETETRNVFGSFVSIGSHANSTSTIATETSDAISRNAARRQMFSRVALVGGKMAAIRDVRKKEFELTKAVRREVKAYREIDHVNVCRLLGACLEVPQMCVLSEYCPKGSLNDVLLNHDVPLTWAFRFSFATDIARGMKELHAHGLTHGALKSHNCVLDDRWNVKVTDFGIPMLRREDEGMQGEEEANKARQYKVYRAPELQALSPKTMSTPTDAAPTPTPASDVYAFGVILVEIATREDPYGDEDPESVPDSWIPPLPALDEEAGVGEEMCPSPRHYNKLITQCWSPSPAARPCFEDVVRSLKNMNPSKLSPIDLMMAMMEKYSKHLESLVADRTSDLVAEKHKTDRLLYTMLPRVVADELRQGKTVSAESYDSCTIYFSDIVGFTTISGHSTPIQVVGLLNKLYNTFDNIIDNYDVYKVETIGDAYMVVSGVPNKNGTAHAREVACMSLQLVAACQTFAIPHLPDQPLQIRVGLHSGSVCAGVVGAKMPRYCLFGDTVNTASRMESSGEAYRVHVSSVTKALLDTLGGFSLTERGVTSIKGKGDMTTYWLIGKLT